MEVFHKLINIIGEYVKNYYIFIIDSVDHLVPASLTWIPEIIPEVSLISFLYNKTCHYLTFEGVHTVTHFLAGPNSYFVGLIVHF